jgi:hypothetical protein
MERYDPDIPPLPKEWLALDDDERTFLVEQYHRDARIKLPKRARAVHAVIHTVVENQLALEDQVIVRDTLSRIVSEGLTRHEAIHAIGSVLVAYFHERFNEEQPASEDHSGYYASLKDLTAEKWRGG